MTGISARSATGVGVASLVAAASGYVVLVIAANVLDKAQNAEFLVFWGLLFFLFGTLGGLQSEVTRSVHVARTASPTTGAPAGSGTRVLPLGLFVGACLAAAIAITSPIWGRTVLGPQPVVAVMLIALAVIAFGGHSAVAGSLAGRGRWTVYSRLVGAEALMRLALVTGVAVAGATEVGLQAATAAAAATWLLMSLASNVRDAWGQRTEATRQAFLASSRQAMIGAASSAALVVGFPVLLRVSTPPEAFAVAAPLLLAVQLTRAPLLIPLNAYQGVAITHFVNHRDEGARPLLRLATMIGAVGVVGAIAAALVGPWLMETLLGDGYRVEPAVLGALTLTAAMLALLTMTGAACLALDGHRAYAVGWLAATALSAAVLLMPGGLEVRVIASLAVGPVAGTVVHAAWIRSTLRSRR
ncbi:hypothetical protein [Pengzhenrongella frigida]|uniref:Polysaccharide biosynthesis protein n=1 Tax=Pengzhenrongella frigida TaxID=1259133 RepID=A0A4Q5N040_9MICO|nr:hypothetical protein [Cellulomonas sp. HLT2-17]RYV51380.1 hypothetical protein EUA98_08830 [Cellulomonas sp. HLT2-17]